MSKGGSMDQLERSCDGSWGGVGRWVKAWDESESPYTRSEKSERKKNGVSAQFLTSSIQYHQS